MLAVLLMALDDHKEADNLTLLVRNYQDRLYNRAYKLLGNREDAEDAATSIMQRPRCRHQSMLSPVSLP